jgi:hypothetical protein
MTNSWCPQNFPAEPAKDMHHAPMLAMLHTVPSLVTDMETLASDTVPGLHVLHYVDESLLQDTIAKGKRQDTFAGGWSTMPATPRNQVPRHCW